MKKLAQREEQIMQVLWEQGPSFVKEIVEALPNPKPHYNSVSTMVRILQSKGFINHKAFGKTHQYFAVISKETYQAQAVEELVGNYFKGSISEMVSYFAKKEKISEAELTDIIEMIKNQKK